MNIDDQFSWMEEPCTCGDVFGHPDGGDSQCQYCSGAIRLREAMESLLAEGKLKDDVIGGIAKLCRFDAYKTKSDMGLRNIISQIWHFCQRDTNLDQAN